MPKSVDITKGIYIGDSYEEAYKSFTYACMPFWWYFREVLRASPIATTHWQKHDGTALSDEEQRTLVAISLTNYAVYTGIADALAFVEQMQREWNQPPRPLQLHDLRREWKAIYSSLNSSFNALCNLVYNLVDVVDRGSPSIQLSNKFPKDTIKLVKKRVVV